MTSVRVNMVPAHKNAYGFVAESNVFFRPERNRSDWYNFGARYVIRQFKQVELKNGESYGQDCIMFCAIPAIISIQPSANQRANGGSIEIGDEVIIDDVTYVVTAKRYAEPILVRK
jgi:hypothetical protein